LEIVFTLPRTGWMRGETLVGPAPAPGNDRVEPRTQGRKNGQHGHGSPFQLGP
jgi:hypothetical protein